MREMSHRINRFDGRPFSPEQIYTTTHLILGELLGASRARRRLDRKEQADASA